MGVEEPMPTLPNESMMNAVVVANPFVEEATAKSGVVPPCVFATESFAYGVEEPTPKRLLVSSQKKLVVSPVKAVPLANWTAPVPPAAEAPAPGEIHVPLTLTQPALTSMPFSKVEVAVVEAT